MRNRRVILKSRPSEVAQADNFAVEEAPLASLADGEIMVRNEFLSVEPAMRGWIADTAGYAEPIAIGSVMRALAVGRVVESQHPFFSVGEPVVGWFGWQELAKVGPEAVVRKVTERDLPISLTLGVLGINGVTALLALEKIGEPREGETVLVSTAAGAVGSAVGQIARIFGCRAIGIAGGPEKKLACIEDYGFDAALDYRADDLDAGLAALCPDGVNVYFDNTAGPISDAAHRHLAIGARLVVCGTAAIANWEDWPVGPRVERHLLVKRARMQGFVIFDHMEAWTDAVARLANWVRDGRLRYREDILDGIDACPDALAGLYRGENLGKRIIKL